MFDFHPSGRDRTLLKDHSNGDYEFVVENRLLDRDFYFIIFSILVGFYWKSLLILIPVRRKLPDQKAILYRIFCSEVGKNKTYKNLVFICKK